MNQSTFLSDLLLRLKTERPDFFKKLQIVAVILGGLSAAFSFVIAEGLQLPHFVQTISTYLATICGSVYFTSFLPNQDKPKDAIQDSPSQN